MKNYKIYYINLDKSKQRNAFMQEQLKKLNQQCTRITAVNGSELDESIIKQAGKNQSLIMSLVKPNAGQVGCFLSHAKAWEIIQEQKEDFAILFEDDIVIHKELIEDLNSILSLISKNDYISLSGAKGKIVFEKKELLTKWVVPAHGAMGQIIGKNAAKNLYQNMSIYRTAVDNMLRFVYIYKTPIWTSNKVYVATVDDKLGGSTIGYQKNTTGLINSIKPVWKMVHIIMKLNLKFQNYLFYRFREK